MKTKRQYEMSSLVSQEVPLEELDSAGSVFNPFHRSDTVAGGNESDTITGEMSPVSVEPLKPAKPAGSVLNSMDFDEVASRQWRKHQLRRFFQDKGKRFSSSQMTTLWKWVLLIVLAMSVGCMGGFVKILITTLTGWKFGVLSGFMAQNKVASAFFSYIFMSLFYITISYISCYIEPAAAGSGIPEIKAFLNGVDLHNFVKIRLVMTKLIGMCFSVASGLPSGKKGPIIHIGATTGAFVSQGGRALMGFDASWQRFQDFRNDKSKRDFVTYGLAAGVAAVFRAPIGGCLFALEEGASFWSSTLTFRAFFCAMLSLFTVNLLFTDSSFGRSASSGLFVFGQFHNYDKNLTNYYSYELFIFMILGVSGGLIGAAWNELAKAVLKYYATHMTTLRMKAIRVALMVILMCCISFLFSISWQICTPKPALSDITDWEAADAALLDELVAFQCPEGTYNQLASLYLVPSDTAIRQLFHFREYEGTSHATFDVAPLILFVIPYFIMAALIGGLMVPTGLFVPSILAGAAYGRIWGHTLNLMFPGYVADAGTYALMGAAAINGGITRMTISMTIIMLETAGNMTYLLPLMVTFASARYTGNAFNMGIYDIQMYLKNLPYLDSSLHTLGLLNYNPVAEIMSTPVVTLSEIDKVSTVYKVLKETSHNGYPVVDLKGKLRGLILRKTLTSLLKFKGFSAPVQQQQQNTGGAVRRGSHIDTQMPGHAVPLAVPTSTIFHETVEKQYPNYPTIDSIELTEEEKGLWLDLRSFMDTSCYAISSSASILRTHSEFRTMGMRHMVVLDGEHTAIGMITRKDILDKTLRNHWQREGKELEQNINVEAIPPGIVYDFSKPAAPSSAVIPTDYSEYGGGGHGGLSSHDHCADEDEDEIPRPVSHKAAQKAASGEIGDYVVVSGGEEENGVDDNESVGDLVGQSAEFWMRLGISRDRRQSQSEITRDDFCNEDDHLETAEDAPDLEFHDRLQRQNSSTGADTDGNTSNGGDKDKLKWSGLRMPTRKR